MTTTTTRECWTCPTTESPTWWTYTVDGKTYTACEHCAVKTDEIELGTDVIYKDSTTCTQIT